ncbi:hypothetical protein ATCC90586_011520 [Pythium insidiosum]|nr:hypothetical protein ATCC90586_011520 [Pythium insidiosum]
MASSSSSLLPMWRSPTACADASSWETETSVSETSTRTPSRVEQCLNFLAQVQRLEVRETTRRRLDDADVVLDVFLEPRAAAEPRSSTAPTFQVRKTLRDFDLLREQIRSFGHAADSDRRHVVSRRKQARRRFQNMPCQLCERLSFAHHWPSRLERVFQSTTKTHELLQATVSDLLQAVREAGDGAWRPCDLQRHLPRLLADFLVPELMMET